MTPGFHRPRRLRQRRDHAGLALLILFAIFAAAAVFVLLLGIL